ncbi:MAG TPA: MFS transporter [Polyangiaceae bacterium]
MTSPNRLTSDAGARGSDPATGLGARASRRTITALTVCQALLFTNNAILISLGGLAGQALAPHKHLATLPVTAGVVGGALTTFYASVLMQRVGRRAGFTLGAAFGVLGAAICSLSLVLSNFWGFCLGSLVCGVYNAFGGYYRFAAAEAARPEAKANAISIVLVGGLAGGILGPWTSRHTKELFATPFLGSYLSLFAFLAVVLVTLRFVALSRPTGGDGPASARPLRRIVSEPLFIVAALSAALGYGVMSLLMTATPLAMGACGHPYGDATTVIASHVVAMFAPALVTGRLIQRFGVFHVMLAGVALNLACVGVALAGADVPHFLGALVLLGVGWNFMYIGGTTLLSEVVRPADRARAQGMNDLAIFVTMVLSSFASGVIVERDGWRTLNLAAVPFLLAAGGAIVWVAARRPRAA